MEIVREKFNLFLSTIVSLVYLVGVDLEEFEGGELGTATVMLPMYRYWPLNIRSASVRATYVIVER